MLLKHILTRAGNAKILNEDTGDDLLTETKMTSYQFTYALIVSHATSMPYH